VLSFPRIRVHERVALDDVHGVGGEAALEGEDEPRVLLIALRHLAQAQGIAKVAKAAGIERESLYRALSVLGNPRLSTLVAVTKAIGLRLTVKAAQ
jgi:probable addiction module antidote protein